MADNVGINEAASPTTQIAADEFVDPTLGTVKSQIIKVYDGTLGSSNAWAVDSTGAGKVNVSSMPAADRTTDSIAVAQQSGVVMIGATVYTVGKAVINTATTGDHTLVALTAGKVIRPVSLWLIAAGTVTVTFASSTGTTTPLAGPIPLVANTGLSLPFDPSGVMNDTATGVILNLNLSAAIQVSGFLKYIVV